MNLYDCLCKNGLSDFKIMYKLHPDEDVENNSQYERLLKYKYNIEIIGKNNDSLYECFAKSQIQIGVYSTGLYEGIAFNLKTFILKINGSQYLSDLVSEGHAVYVTAPAQIIQCLKDSSENRYYENSLWEKNALNNLNREIDYIVRKN